MHGTAVLTAQQETNEKERIPSLVEIIRKTGRINECLATRSFHDNEENLVENLVVAAARFFKDLPKVEADLLAQGLKDGTMFERLAERLQEEFVERK